MIGEETRDIEKTLLRVKRMCKAIKILCIATMGIFSVLWITVLGIAAFAAFQEGFDISALGSLIHMVVFGLIVIALFGLSIRIFSDVIQGNSLFDSKQITRIRIAAILFLAITVTDAVASFEYSFDTEVAGLSLGVTHNQEYTPPQENTAFMLNINGGPLILSIVLYCLSVAFEYGALLQRYNDETL